MSEHSLGADAAAMDFGLPDQGGAGDPWNDPRDHRGQLRRRLVRYQAGFLLLGVALSIASFTSLARILAQQVDLLPLLVWLRQWEFLEGSSVVLGSLAGVALLWGQWPDQSWQRRSGLLLLLCLVDLVSWSIDHATRLGLSEVAFGHDYFRYALGVAIGWSEFALIASMAAGMAGLLGEPRADEFGQAARALTTLTAAVWLMFFFLSTNWNAPVWPLRPFPPNRLLSHLYHCWTLLYTILLVQVTMLCLGAARACGRVVRRMATEDRARDSQDLPSERSWNELQQQAPTDFNPWESHGKSSS